MSDPSPNTAPPDQFIPMHDEWRSRARRRIEVLEAEAKRNAEGWSDAVARIGELEAALREIEVKGAHRGYNGSILSQVARRALEADR